MKLRLDRVSGAVLLGLIWCASVATPAYAIYEPLSSGSTKLLLDKSFFGALKSEGVSLAVRPPARLAGRTVLFPVVAGKVDPTNGRGTVEHEGALIFEKGRNRVPLKDLQLKTTRKSSPLAAKVGGSQLKLATAADLEVVRSGFGERISASKLTLSAKLATRLGKKLGARDLFKAGMALGRTATVANPETIALAQKNRVELALSASFQAKLASLFVAVNPVFPAEHPGAFTLPIFGGTISPRANLGIIETLGALEFLQLGGGQVLWHESWLDLGAKAFAPEMEILPSPPYVGKQDRAGVATLASTATSANATARTVSFAGQLALDAPTAATFNEIFAKPLGKTDVFVPGEALGGLTLTGQGQ